MRKVKPTLITVLMSVYNGESFLSEAIESILNQSFKDFEFIIINDGSTDKSLSIIKGYMLIDRRIVLISRENKGLITSLNEGIALAKGKYIARMDADDISLPERLEEQVTFMNGNPEVGASGSWAEVFGDGVEPKLIKHPAITKELKPKLLFSVCFVHPTVMLRKEVLEKFNLRYDPNALHVEDYELWTRLIEKTEVANIQKVLLKYRYVDTSISRTADSDKTNKRYIQLKRVFSIQLEKVGLVNSEAENLLHYIVLSNKRLSETKINLVDLDAYFRKIINANHHSHYCDEAELLNFLSKKFLATFCYQVYRNKWNVMQTSSFHYAYIYVKHKVLSYFRSR